MLSKFPLCVSSRWRKFGSDPSFVPTDDKHRTVIDFSEVDQYHTKIANDSFIAPSATLSGNVEVRSRIQNFDFFALIRLRPWPLAIVFFGPVVLIQTLLHSIRSGIAPLSGIMSSFVETPI
jgi:hypothetical protein